MTSDFGFNGIRRVPAPVNEPVKAYAPGSAERAELKARLDAMARERIEIPLVIGGREVRGGERAVAVMPHDHAHVLADWHKAGPEHVEQAIAAAASARREWASWPWEDRLAVFLKAAELLATSWRAKLARAVALPRSAAWAEAVELVQANTLAVRTTRVPCACAALITDVIAELVQPPHPVVTDPFALRFLRLPAVSAPTEKYAIVVRTA